MGVGLVGIKVDIHKSHEEVFLVETQLKVFLTLDSGINIGVCLLIFGLFSRGYVPY